jgi:hypothetical protein
MYVRLLGSMPVLQEIINTRRWCSAKQTITRQLPLFVQKEAFTIIVINVLLNFGNVLAWRGNTCTSDHAKLETGFKSIIFSL